MKWIPEPYMQVAKDFLLSHNRAGLFASPGLSKTAISLAALNDLFVEGQATAALVVAPLRVSRLTWRNEIAKWDNFKWMKWEILSGSPCKPSGRAQIYLTNYENLHNLRDLSFVDVVIFDELTRAKNPKSIRINKLRPYLEPRHLRWGLTGTPRPNSLLELFGQIRLLDDGDRLSPSFIHYRSTYFSATDYNEYNWVPKPGAEQKVYEKIADLTLTLRASDYLDIPDTIVEDIEIPLPKDAHDFYAKLEKELVVLLAGGSAVVARSAGILVNKLLQVSGGAVYDEEKKVVPLHVGKINALKKLIVDLGDERCLIACNYIHERTRILAAIPGVVDASTYEGDIETDWNAGKIRHLVADPRSLGHGLNLQGGGRTVIWFSPTWSRELYDQFNARVARKGQGRETQIYRLVCSGTMDDAVIETLRTRGDEQGAMMELLTNWQNLGRTFSK